MTASSSSSFAGICRALVLILIVLQYKTFTCTAYVDALMCLSSEYVAGGVTFQTIFLCSHRIEPKNRGVVHPVCRRAATDITCRLSRQGEATLNYDTKQQESGHRSTPTHWTMQNAKRNGTKVLEWSQFLLRRMSSCFFLWHLLDLFISCWEQHVTNLYCVTMQRTQPHCATYSLLYSLARPTYYYTDGNWRVSWEY